MATAHRTGLPAVVESEESIIRTWTDGPHSANWPEVRHCFQSWTDTRSDYPSETRSVLDGVEDAFNKIERGEVLRRVVTF
jgi:hypothetical protein